MSIDNDTDFVGMRCVGRIVAATLARVRAEVRAGVTTAELDAVALETLTEHGARSAPQLDYDFPGTICISVNEEAVHGIPGPRVLTFGDVVTIDVTAELDGYYADAAVTVAIPHVSPRVERLCEAAEAAFWKALKLAVPGAPLWRVGAQVEAEVRRRGFRVIRDLTGHGIGRRIHEEPSVPNYRDPEARERLTDGLVIALEPIVSMTASRSRLLADGWTVASADGSVTAHFEHTIVVRHGEPVVLTAA
jgi:methionyl aminopeptidase